MKLRLLIYSILICSVTNCAYCQHPKQSQSIQDSDSNPSKEKEDLGLLDFKISSDTLSIYSTNKILYYPFGVYNSIEDFEGKLNPSMNKRIEYSRSHNDSTRLYRLSYKSSFIKLVKDNEKNTIEIVSAVIKDKEISLRNGISIDITKAMLIEKFIGNAAAKDQFRDINVVKVESGLTGIWHYYAFENDTLHSFNFTTDYLLNQD